MPSNHALAVRPSANDLPQLLRWSGIWLILVAWCQVAGWSLSWLGALNTTGYLASSPIAFAAIIWFWRATRPSSALHLSGKKWLRRGKKSPALFAWCVVTLLIFIGAAISPPSNFDGVNYRLPRLLYWLQENRWHWIDGLDHRQNISGVGIEWMSAPFILFTHSDRGLFLINFLPFLLLPGLFFIAARGLGIRSQVARWWMWVWPMAYGIALQAGSIGNDMVAAALALASLAFAAQALRTRPFLCLFFSALAAAAMTSVKATALPLGLPFAIYWLWVAWKTLPWPKILVVGLGVLPIASFASIIPIAIACTIHTGIWNGNPGNRHGAEPLNPIAGLIGNTIEFGTGLIQPPVLPMSASLNQSLARVAESQPWYRWTKTNYPCFNITLGGELPSEEGAGVGLGLTAVISFWFLTFRRRKPALPSPSPLLSYALIAATAIAMLAFMLKAGMGGTARLILPFIPFFILSILIGFRNRSLPQRHLSILLQIIPAAFLIPALFLNPNRPVVPAAILCSLPGIPAAFKQRMTSVYEVYQRRSSLLAPLQKQIPQGETIGFAGGIAHSALGLFKPYGSRKVINLSPRTESRLHWFVATPQGFEGRMGMPMNAWVTQNHFQKVTDIDIISRVKDGPETWSIYQRKP